MVFRIHFYVTAVLSILIVHKATCAPLLDPVDECILICDACFKEQFLLNCANECLSMSGDVSQFWKNRCPYFDAKTPNVQMI